MNTFSYVRVLVTIMRMTFIELIHNSLIPRNGLNGPDTSTSAAMFCATAKSVQVID